VDGHTPYGIKPFLQTRYAQTLAQLAVARVPVSQGLEDAVAVFPNPSVVGQAVTLHAKVFPKADLVLEVVDAMGRVLETRVWPSYAGSLELRLDRFPPGKYWLRLAGKDVNGVLGIVRM
jgi:hypothetical protein